MTETVECAVIGAGVVGLAIARALAQAGREVVILEAAEAIGTGISSRNSEVIHAGIYYPPGSLKARLCVAGRRSLYAFCASHGVDHRRCGKLLVATSEPEIAALSDFKARAEANGVDDLEWLDRDALKRLEPALHAVAGMLSPSSGIVDSHGLMLALLGDAEEAGAMLGLVSPVIGGQCGEPGPRLTVGGVDPMDLDCRWVVNAAGLGAQAVAAAISGVPPATIPKLYLAKGNYFALSGRAPFSRLIYPMPDAASLGVHLTLDLGGQAKFGPDVEWVEREDYTVDPRRGDSFYAAIRRYWPDLPDGALMPAYAGVRPKLQAPGEPPADFVIQGPAEHGIPGLVNLFGIESPGLTSSLALADVIARVVG